MSEIHSSPPHEDEGSAMASVVNDLKSQLEERGEYVVLANTPWFAINPSTWKTRLEQAKRGGANCFL